MRQKLNYIVSGIIALALGVVVWLNFSPQPTEIPATRVATKQATILPYFKALPPFSLTDQTGAEFNNKRLLGQWTFLSFGYTHCPDICPTTLAMLTNMEERLNSYDLTFPYQIAFVSIDPERDTQRRLAEYVNYFDPSFLGVTGSENSLQSLTQPLGILYAKVKTEKSALGYVMDHSASIILIDPEGRYHALFSPPHDASTMAEDFMKIANAY